ncbi:RxLR effector protein [Phytophthora megakarya]|uniref:RxLR effector protein n=1 Tax=Phytophthora megakarya TaxID=4795 RepID=A0A225WXF6_9STRA|nr:RxLR effector protein [Phytophthora megakarya]
MRLTYMFMIAVSALSVNQVPVTASVGSNTSRSINDPSRFLRGSNVAEGDKEERGWNFADIVEQLMNKHLFNKLVRTESFSALDKVDDLARLDKISDTADDHLKSIFEFADQQKMRPDDLVDKLRTFDELDEDFIKKAVGMYTNYLQGIGKIHVDWP